MWDPKSSICDLLEPVAAEILGTEVDPNNGDDLAYACIKNNVGSSPVRVSLNRIESSVGEYLSVSGDRIAREPKGPRDATWNISTENADPDQTGLAWTGNDLSTWELTVDTDGGEAYKPRIIKAALEIARRIPKK